MMMREGISLDWSFMPVMQMTITGVPMELNFSSSLESYRVVPARELSLDEIRDIKG